MPRGKPFVCWLGRDHSAALYIGDVVQFRPPTSDEWLTGKFGIKRCGAYVVRVGRKEYPIYFIYQLRAIESGAMLKT